MSEWVDPCRVSNFQKASTAVSEASTLPLYVLAKITLEKGNSTRGGQIEHGRTVMRSRPS